MTPVKAPPLVLDNLVLNFDPSRGYTSALGINGILDLSGRRNTILSSSTISYNSGPPANYVFISGSSISYQTSSNWNFGTGDFTISAWVRPTSTPEALIITDTRDPVAPANNSNAFNINISTSLNVRIFTALATIITSTNLISLNKWNNVTASRIGTTLSLYINDSFNGSIINSNNFSNPYLTIGTASVLPQNYFRGDIGQILVYKGLGLTQAQVTQNFNATRFIYGV